MHKFARPDGIGFTVPKVNGPGFEVVQFQGYLILLCADTLAAADLIGFNRSFGKNVKSVCWQCNCTGKGISDLDGFTRRSQGQYNRQREEATRLKQVELAHGKQRCTNKRRQDNNATTRTRTHESFMQSIGIRTFEHAFANIPYFSVVSMVPRDLMHVELEGTLKSHLYGVLYMALCKLKWFTRIQFNAALRAWPFPKGSSRPDVIFDNPKGELVWLGL